MITASRSAMMASNGSASAGGAEGSFARTPPGAVCAMTGRDAIDCR